MARSSTTCCGVTWPSMFYSPWIATPPYGRLAMTVPHCFFNIFMSSYIELRLLLVFLPINSILLLLQTITFRKVNVHGYIMECSLGADRISALLRSMMKTRRQPSL